MTANERFEEAKAYYDNGVYDQSVPKLQALAGEGHGGAQCYLGNAYSVGNGVAKDPAKAAEWQRKAAAQGYDWAQYSRSGGPAKGNTAPPKAAPAYQLTPEEKAKIEAEARAKVAAEMAAKAQAAAKTQTAPPQTQTQAQTVQAPVQAAPPKKGFLASLFGKGETAAQPEGNPADNRFLGVWQRRDDGGNWRGSLTITIKNLNRAIWRHEREKWGDSYLAGTWSSQEWAVNIQGSRITLTFIRQIHQNKKQPGVGYKIFEAELNSDGTAFTGHYLDTGVNKAVEITYTKVQ